MLDLYERGREREWLATFRFYVDLVPRYCELDGLSHVSNTVYPEYLELSRLQYFKAAGDPEKGPYAFTHVVAELRLRYVAAAYYDEPLRVFSKLVRLGRSSATMHQAIVGAAGDVRAVSEVAVVRSYGEQALPWSDAQRLALFAFEPHLSTPEDRRR
ncbi:MAG: acyl-CoA thioesterase [Candidatus Eremiobacteraeota bacterium]|nr:acyl-CoA thioesterase [Candidatus Eremiobacteraeota bacterium]